MKDIAPILRSLGLVESEIKTYLAAIEKGPQTVLDLTKQTGLSRQATYVAIDSLTERGLMSSALRGKKRFYSAEHPSRLLAYAKRHESEMQDKLKELERSLPELELQMGGEKPTVKFFEGREGVRALLTDLQVDKPKQVHEITDLDALRTVLTAEDLQPMRDAMVEAGAYSKGIYSGTPKPSATNAERYVLPPELSGFKTNISVYDNKVAIVTFEGKMYSIIIENAALTKTLRILFELAIKCLPKKQ